MTKKRVGILLTGDFSWPGGVYYSLNILKLLCLGKNNEFNLYVAIINNHTPYEVVKEIESLNVEMVNIDRHSFLYKLLHKLKSDRFEADINALNLDVIYPLITYAESHKKIKAKVIYWIYDLQHKFLPHLFTKDIFQSRDQIMLGMSMNADTIVFSSHDSKQHFVKFYPNTKAQLKVFQFVSLIDHYKLQTPNTHLSSDIPYFIVCNQFWPHKNHLLVLQATKMISQREKEFKLIFTGKFDAENGDAYNKEIARFINDNNLQGFVTFTGFISRAIQIDLMRHSLAIIQPSLFEGWSTVVEDAKALNQPLIASDLNVHIEQAENYAYFFEGNNAQQLAQLMINFLNGNQEFQEVDYNENIQIAQRALNEIL
jgi:glycosyltransferase involved in cell wall biosynthesis